MNPTGCKGTSVSLFRVKPMQTGWLISCGIFMLFRLLKFSSSTWILLLNNWYSGIYTLDLVQESREAAYPAVAGWILCILVELQSFNGINSCA